VPRARIAGQARPRRAVPGVLTRCSWYFLGPPAPAPRWPGLAEAETTHCYGPGPASPGLGPKWPALAFAQTAGSARFRVDRQNGTPHPNSPDDPGSIPSEIQCLPVQSGGRVSSLRLFTRRPSLFRRQARKPSRIPLD